LFAGAGLSHSSFLRTLAYSGAAVFVALIAADIARSFIDGHSFPDRSKHPAQALTLPMLGVRILLTAFLGAIYTSLVFIGVGPWTPFIFLILLAGLQAIPQEPYEAALIDGCGTWSAFRRVTLPLSSPGLAATAVICFILSWNDFFYALILTRTQASTAPVAIVNFIQYTGWEWGRIAAAGTLVMLPVVAFSILVRNYLVRGLAAGGVKE
jgi:ABC-type glycerol-3-phosphate transport system permease component